MGHDKVLPPYVIQVSVHFRSLVCSYNNNCLLTNQNNYHVPLTLFHVASVDFYVDDASTQMS